MVVSAADLGGGQPAELGGGERRRSRWWSGRVDLGGGQAATGGGQAGELGGGQRRDLGGGEAGRAGWWSARPIRVVVSAAELAVVRAASWVVVRPASAVVVRPPSSVVVSDCFDTGWWSAPRSCVGGQAAELGGGQRREYRWCSGVDGWVAGQRSAMSVAEKPPSWRGGRAAPISVAGQARRAGWWSTRCRARWWSARRSWVVARPATASGQPAELGGGKRGDVGGGQRVELRGREGGDLGRGKTRRAGWWSARDGGVLVSAASWWSAASAGDLRGGQPAELGGGERADAGGGQARDGV